MASLDFLRVFLNMRYYFVEQDDITVANARGLREVAHERELAVEDLVGGQIRLRSGSATAPNAPGGEPTRRNRRRALRQREQLSTRRRPRLNYQS